MIETGRLILRPWRRRDLAPFAAMSADPEVMAHFPKTLTRAESAAMVSRMQDLWAADGFCFAAVERRQDGAFLGMAGLARARFEAAPCPCVEVGWRLAREHWGQGYATEAADAWLAYGFGTLDLTEIVAFTVPANAASQAVMRRLGMHRDPGRDFEHPALPAGSPLRPHHTYALARTDWSRAANRAIVG